MMKNITIGILAILCLMFFFFGLTQRTAAEKSQKEAVYNYTLAQENALRAAKAAGEAKKQQMAAEANAQEDHRQRLIAEQNLLECIKRKK